MFRRRSGISEQHPRHRTVLDGVSVRRRFTASSFRFWGSVTSGRLGRVKIVPQLKVDRLCSVVDGTADFDPEPTSDTVPASDRSWAARSDSSPLISQLRPPMGEDEYGAALPFER